MPTTSQEYFSQNPNFNENFCDSFFSLQKFFATKLLFPIFFFQKIASSFLDTIKFFRFGRKPAAIVTTTALFFAMNLSSVSPNFYVFLVFSVIAGICVGGSLTIAFTYWAEVSSTSYRYEVSMTIYTLDILDNNIATTNKNDNIEINQMVRYM